MPHRIKTRTRSFSASSVPAYLSAMASDERASSTHNWSHNTARDHARVQYGNHYGDNHETHYHTTGQDPKQVLLESLRFEGMERYHDRPLDSFDTTFEWILEPRSESHKCDKCEGASPDMLLDGYSGPRRDEYWLLDDCRQAKRYDGFRNAIAAKFQDWLASSQEMFWISGKAGSGKSTLMYLLLHHEQTSARLSEWGGLAGFFFWAAGGELEKSQEGLMCSLLHQILVRHPDLIEDCLKGRSSSTGPETRPWKMRDLRQALQKALTKLDPCTRFCFFIDGLDEFQGDHLDLIQMLEDLNRSSKVKLCVSSRPWTEFKTAFGAQSNPWQLQLHDLTWHDIQSYVDGRLQGDARFIPHDMHKLAEDVCEKASGVFLWVRLAVNALRSGMQHREGMDELRQRLSDLPPDLDGLLQRLLNNIEKEPRFRVFAARTLLMLIREPWKHGKSPLIYLTLLEEDDRDPSSVFEPRIEPLSDTESQQMLDSAERSVKKWCGDLIEITRSQVSDLRDGLLYNPHYLPDFIQWPHRTVYDFLHMDSNLARIEDWAGKDFDPNLTSSRVLIRLAKCIQLAWSEFRMVVAYAFFRVANIIASSFDDQLKLLLEECDDIGLRLYRRPDEAHWTFSSVKYVDMFPKFSDEVTARLAFPSLALNSGYIRLFRILQDMDPIRKTTAAQHLWMECLITEIFLPYNDHSNSLDTLQEFLAQGIDLNWPIPRTGGLKLSVWQVYLVKLGYRHAHQYREVVRLLLENGADPDILLPSPRLYYGHGEWYDYRMEHFSADESEWVSGSDFFSLYNKFNKHRPPNSGNSWALNNEDVRFFGKDSDDCKVFYKRKTSTASAGGSQLRKRDKLLGLLKGRTQR